MTAFLRVCADAGKGASLAETTARDHRTAETASDSAPANGAAPTPAPSLPWRPRLLETTVFDLFDADWAPAVSAVSDGVASAAAEGLLSRGRRADLQVSWRCIWGVTLSLLEIEAKILKS